MFYTKADFLFYEPAQILSVEANPKNAVIERAEMTPFQHAFLCGLLRKKKPAKILEIGVSAGGTSCVIMNCLKMLGSNAEFHSVDLLNHYYLNKKKATGYLMEDVFPGEAKSHWRLYLGHTVAAHLDKIGDGVDFCILDASHTLPGELLDFIAVFPYLSPGAVVIVHDTSLHFEPGAKLCYATRVLLSSVTAEKIICHEALDSTKLSNIAAFIVNSDTGKYINDCFSALAMEWIGCLEQKFVDEYRQVISAKYGNELTEYFDSLVKIQKTSYKRRNPFPVRCIRGLVRRVFGHFWG